MSSIPEKAVMPTVLIVDDDSMMRLLLRETLEQADLAVSEAADGEQALAWLEGSKPDLVLLDVDLPGIDGFEVCRHMRRIADSASLPIVMVTGLDDTASISRAYEAGATDFIAKPINWPVLGHRARYILRGASTMRSLRAAEERNSAMLRAIPDAIFRLDKSGTVIDYKPAVGREHEYILGNLVGSRLSDVLPAPAAEAFSHALDETLASGCTRSINYTSTLADSKRHYDARLVMAGADEVLVLVQDVSQRIESEFRMREALMVFEACSQGIMTTDSDGVITSINPALCEMTGYSREEVIGCKPSMFRSNWHDKAFYSAMWSKLLDAGAWEGEIWNRRKNGEVYPEWESISAVRDADGKIVEFVALCSDITQRKQQEEAMWRQANFDPLTGLANRNLLHDRLERSLSQARRKHNKLGLMFIDLDGFKWINDTLGHDVGDDLLIQVSRRLQCCVREQDTAARLGGDEFTLVLQDLSDADDLLAIGEKVVAVLREPFTLAGGAQHLSGSVGITIFPDDGDDVQALLKNADIAMYKAKEAGKNRFQFYAQHMQTDALVRVQLIADLHVAIAQRAFALHYQPIVDAESGELVGAEALIRWKHPERGDISPQEFIPLAEDCGLINGIGEWVLREAARQWQEWSSRGHPRLRLSVNVSGLQFRESELPGLLASILQEHQVDPAYFMLEITESVLMRSDKAAEARMQEIKACGVGYALDDFGTGFSSLSYLKRFPVDIVKIDKSFVNDCPADPNDVRLVEAIINMAHSLGLRVTAEGVETEAQMSLLRDLGCNYLQGWLIGKALPPDEFEVLIRRRQLLPQVDHSTLQAKLFLATLRLDDLDVDTWLSNVLGGRSPELAAFKAQSDWTCRGLSLRDAVQAHLDLRRQLNDYVTGRQPASFSEASDTSSAKGFLGQWIMEHDIRSDPDFARLGRAHREFHKLAAEIVATRHDGNPEGARRMLVGMQFRNASCELVKALINCFRQDEANEASVQPQGAGN